MATPPDTPPVASALSNLTKVCSSFVCLPRKTTSTYKQGATRGSRQSNKPMIIMTGLSQAMSCQTSLPAKNSAAQKCCCRHWYKHRSKSLRTKKKASARINQQLHPSPVVTIKRAAGWHSATTRLRLYGDTGQRSTPCHALLHNACSEHHWNVRTRPKPLSYAYHSPPGFHSFAHLRSTKRKSQL